MKRPADVRKAPVFLIPVYMPVTSLTDTVEALCRSGAFSGGIVVDDGSRGPSRALFSKMSAAPGVTLLTHAANRGKGAALKTGMAHIQEHLAEAVAVVTADGDGQHAVGDILKVAAASLENPGRLILGSRRFSGGVPLRSRLGNRLSSLAVRLTTGRWVRDTQTGLRGLPMEALGWMRRLGPTGYDFEMDLLLTCISRGTPLVEIGIDTIYHGRRSRSYFRPVTDSARVVSVVLRHLAGARRRNGGEKK